MRGKIKIIEFMDRLKFESKFKKDFENISIKVEKDGTVTLKGLKYSDFTMLLTAASLHRYDHPYKVEKHQPDFERYLKDNNPGMAEVVAENAKDDQLWHIREGVKAEALKNLASKALDLHNKKATRR